MAIYKPTFCSPIEGSFEITTTTSGQTTTPPDLPLYIECQIDTSNTLINGYSIELFDEDGNRKFPITTPPDVPNKTVITSIYSWKTVFATDPNIDVSGNGRNGTKLKFPFVVSAKSGTAGDWSVQNNQILYSDLGTYDVANNKKYYWKLTLYQLADSNNSQLSSALVTPDSKFYDMSLTTGTVLGSTNERIQTVKSDNIAIDYYVQPVYIKNLSVSGEGTTSYDPTNWTCAKKSGSTTEGDITNVGSRALIKSYDSTNGHIYPVVGSDGIQDDTIQYETTTPPTGKVANGIRVYKMSNNENDLNAYQKVAAAPEYVVPWSNWVTSTENPGDSYGVQEYYIYKQQHEDNIDHGTQYYYPFDIIKSATPPLQTIGEAYSMGAPISTTEASPKGSYGDYLLSVPKSGAGLYAIYPEASSTKVSLVLNSYKIGETTYSVYWLTNPIYDYYSNKISYGWGLCRFGDLSTIYLVHFQIDGDPSAEATFTASIISYQNLSITDSNGINFDFILTNSSTNVGQLYLYQRESYYKYVPKSIYYTGTISPHALPTTKTIGGVTYQVTYTSNLSYGTLKNYGPGSDYTGYIAGAYLYGNTAQHTLSGYYLIGINTSFAIDMYMKISNLTDLDDTVRLIYNRIVNGKIFSIIYSPLCNTILWSALLTYDDSGAYEFEAEVDDGTSIGMDPSDIRIVNKTGNSNHGSGNYDLVCITGSSRDCILKYFCDGNSYSVSNIHTVASGETYTSAGYVYEGDYFYFSVQSNNGATLYYFDATSGSYTQNSFPISSGSVLNTDSKFRSLTSVRYKHDTYFNHFLCLTIDNVFYYVQIGGGGDTQYYWWGSDTNGLGISGGSTPRIVLNGQINNKNPINSSYVMGLINPYSDVSFSNVFGATSYSSAYNGIYYPKFSTETIYNQVVKVTVRWTRVPDANTWGELSTKIVMVTTGSSELNPTININNAFVGKNIQINRTTAGTTGTINQTEFTFVEEKPVDLYEYTGTPLTNNPDINNTGLIFYNRYVTSTSGNMGYLYIRPFTGLCAGQKYFDKNDLTHTFTIAHVDNLTKHGTWFVNYSAETAWISALKPDEDKYRISTYFNTSDEYWFKTESKPSLIINAPTTTSIPLKYDFTATYTPGNGSYTSWNSYQWQLYEDSAYTTPLQIADVKHSGEIKQTFYGLTPNKTYYVRCVLTTNSNRILEATYPYTVPSQGTKSTAEWYTNVTTPLALQTVVESDLGAIRIKLPDQAKLAWTSCSVLKREWWEAPSTTTSTKSYQPIYKPVAMNITATGKTSVLDYNIGDNHQYEYIVYATTTSGTTYKTAEVEACWMGTVLISLDPSTKSELGTYTAMTGDTKNVWHFRYNLEANSETLNMAHNVQTTLSQYPSFSYGPTQYLTGGFSCLLGDGFKVGDAGGDLNSHTGARSTTGYYENLNTNWGQQYKTSHWAVDRLAEWRKFCASATPKLLKDEKGQVFLVQVTAASNQTNVHWNKQPETITFDWTEIGDSSQLIVAAVV